VVHPIELKFFLQVSDSVLGAYFFFYFENIVPLSFDRSQKRSTIQKNMRFLECSRYFGFFIQRGRDRKETKKVRHSKVFLVSVEKIPAQMNVPSRETGTIRDRFWLL
jgi:hypothetical protein